MGLQNMGIGASCDEQTPRTQSNQLLRYEIESNCHRAARVGSVLLTLYTVQEVSRLANGNTVICNWAGSAKKENWPTVVQIIEVTPDKKVVWALREWTNPDLGPASSIQLLDEPGVAEKGALQR